MSSIISFSSDSLKIIKMAEFKYQINLFWVVNGHQEGLLRWSRMSR
jgi:hypothetical protein